MTIQGKRRITIELTEKDQENARLIENSLGFFTMISVIRYALRETAQAIREAEPVEQSTPLDSMTPAEQFDHDQDKPPNIHENGDHYVVAVWVESAGQYQAPLDAETCRLTGCHTEFARSLDGFAGLTLADARSRAVKLFGYEKLA